MRSSRVAGGVLLPVLVILCVAGTTAHSAAKQPPARPADADEIDRAIEAGVRYLRVTQHPDGHWGKGTGPGSGKGWGVGYTSLAGLTLVECGVPAADPGLRRAAAWVKRYAGELDQTYEVALTILFLDRMGDRKDRRLIHTLAARLVAGQTATGGWGYKVPRLTQPQQDQLLGALRKMSAPQLPPLPSHRDRPSSLGLCIKAADDVVPRAAAPFDAEKARAAALNALPPGTRRLPVFQEPGGLAAADPKEKRQEAVGGTSDNSNTHFAMLAIWAARKHDVPVDRSLVLLAHRFRTSQGADGTWGYDYRKNGGGGSPALTCVALLGLAIGHVVDPDVAVKPEQDPRVVNAFVWLSKRIGQPAGTTVDRPTPLSAGGLYYLWAMERIAVLYDVQSLDKKDWYLWGAEILLCHQSPQGGWEKGGQHVEDPTLSTSLALLFLKRANLTPDLSRRLVVDPSALTQKVTDTVTPKPQPVTPAPKPPETVEPKAEPAPRPAPEERLDPSPPTASEPPPQPQSPAPAAQATSKWPWILLLVVLIAVFAACVFLVMKKRREGAVREEKPRRKKKPKLEAED